MEEEKMDVGLESSPSKEVETPETQEDVNTQPEASPVEKPQEETEAEPSTPEVKPESPPDTRPIENVAWENKRKLDELVPTFRKDIQELKELFQSNQTQQQPEYSKAQLQAYASEPATTTEQRLWAYTEVDKIEKDERKKEYETLVKTTQSRSESQSRKAQSAQWVAQTFPDTTVVDNAGNVVGWNNSSPLLMAANQYMTQSEELRNNPEGFRVAVKMAAFDLGLSQNLSKKVNRTVAQLRKEQKKGLASAGGTRSAETPETASKARMAKLKQEYAKTGRKDIFAEMIKLRGLNPYL